MIDLKRLIQEWRERAKFREQTSPVDKPKATDHLSGMNGEKQGDRNGGEGNAFQVNDPPQVPVDRPAVHGNSEEGNAFQVNDHPEEKTL